MIPFVNWLIAKKTSWNQYFCSLFMCSWHWSYLTGHWFFVRLALRADVTLLSLLFLPSFLCLLPSLLTTWHHHTLRWCSWRVPSSPCLRALLWNGSQFAALPINAWASLSSLLLRPHWTGVLQNCALVSFSCSGLTSIISSGQYFCSSFWRYLPCRSYYSYDLPALLSLLQSLSVSLARNLQSPKLLSEN